MRTLIEHLIRANEWAPARKAIETALQERPDDHVLLTRLAAVFYELGEYDRALASAERARALMPRCPLVLWDLAGILQMVGKHYEALAIYRALVKRRAGWIAKDPCIANRAHAKGLISDSHYRMMHSLDALGQRELASEEFGNHLDLRGPGCYSIYPIGQHHKPGETLRNWRPCAG